MLKYMRTSPCYKHFDRQGPLPQSLIFHRYKPLIIKSMVYETVLQFNENLPSTATIGVGGIDGSAIISWIVLEACRRRENELL